MSGRAAGRGDIGPVRADDPSGRSFVGRALVTDARRGSALAVARSLGRRGWWVMAADPGPDVPAWHSRYVAARARYPDPIAEPDAAAEAVLAAAQREGIDLLVPVTDELALPLAARRDRWPSTTIVAMAPAAAAEVAWDKERTLEIALRLEVPIPPTITARSLEAARKAASELGWPVVLKPARSRLYRPGEPIRALHVSYANDADETARRLEGHDWDIPVLVQAWEEGVGVGVELLLREGRIGAAFQHRRIRAVPVTGGASACRVSEVLDRRLLGYASSLLRELAWSGVAMVEFRLGRHGPRLMEVNGRIWGSLPLALASGVDFPAGLAWAHAPDADPEPPVLEPSPYRVGRRAHNLELEAAWIRSVALGRHRVPYLPAVPRRAVVGAALSLLRPGDAIDTLAADDRRPFVAELRRIVRLSRELARRPGDRR